VPAVSPVIDAVDAPELHEYVYAAVPLTGLLEILPFERLHV
jgi:hypothetical protein